MALREDLHHHYLMVLHAQPVTWPRVQQLLLTSVVDPVLQVQQLPAQAYSSVPQPHAQPPLPRVASLLLRLRHHPLHSMRQGVPLFLFALFFPIPLTRVILPLVFYAQLPPLTPVILPLVFYAQLPLLTLLIPKQAFVLLLLTFIFHCLPTPFALFKDFPFPSLSVWRTRTIHYLQ